MAGLTAAYLLKDLQPIILEQHERFGGNSKGQAWRGLEYSIGAAYIVQPEEGTAIHGLIKELGLDAEWRIKEEEDPVYLEQQIFHEFWSGETFLPGSVGHQQLTTLSRYFSSVLEGEEFSYPEIPFSDEESAKVVRELDKETFAEHLTRIAGGPLHPHIFAAVEQYCWSSFGASTAEVSAAAGVNFFAAEFGSIAVFPGGNSAITERLLERLHGELPLSRLRAGSVAFEVTVLSDGSGVRVRYLDATGIIRSILARSVIMACPKFIGAKLLTDIEPQRVDAIRRLRYRGYLVANVCLQGAPLDPFYDLYMLHQGDLNPADAYGSSHRRQVTDVIMANYAQPDASQTVLSLYRGLPYDAGRAELFIPGSYERFRSEFELQVREVILPALKLNPSDVVDLRIARWGHPLVIPAPGIYSDDTVRKLRQPFKDCVFFAEQDNWALPAFETAVTEAMTCATEVRAYLERTSAQGLWT
jgi:hypothetical protein